MNPTVPAPMTVQRIDQKLDELRANLESADADQWREMADHLLDTRLQLMRDAALTEPTEAP